MHNERIDKLYILITNAKKVYLVSSTGLIMSIGHRKEIEKLTFQALALRRSKSRRCGLCVVYIQRDGTTLLVGAWHGNVKINRIN